MKKTYINPQVNVVYMQSQNCIMNNFSANSVGSKEKPSGFVTEGTSAGEGDLAKGRFFMDGDE